MENMGKKRLICACGAAFLVPELHPPRVPCPGCGESVSTEPPTQTGTPPLLPPQLQRPLYPVVLLAAGGLVVAAALVLLVVFFTGRRRSAPDLLPPLQDRPPAPISLKPVTTTPLPRPVEDKRIRKLADWNTAAALVTAVLASRTMESARSALQEQIHGGEQELQRLAKLSGLAVLPERVRPHDTVLALDGIPATRPQEFHEAVQQRLRAGPAAPLRIQVRRAGLDYTLDLPPGADADALRTLALKLPAPQPAPVPPPPAPPPPPKPPPLPALRLDAPPASAPEPLDVVHLKDGSRKEGRILEEKETGITLDTLLRGPRGEAAGLARLTLPRSEIVRAERVPEAARPRLAERMAAAAARPQRLRDALAGFNVFPADFLGLSGLRVQGAHFELYTTLEESVTREAALTLEDALAALRRRFRVRRNEPLKIPVFLFGLTADLTRFRDGIAAGNLPFDPDLGVVVAVNPLASDEITAARTDFEQAGRRLEETQASLKAADEAFEKQLKDRKNEIERRAGDMRRNSPGDDAKVQVELERAKRQAFEELKVWEKKERERLSERRRLAARSLEEAAETQRRSRKILTGPTRELLEVIQHEVFHAYALTHLDGPDAAALPLWLNEGLASYYERCAVENGDWLPGGAHPAHLTLLREAASRNQLIPLERLLAGGSEFFAVPHDGVLPRRSLVCAEAWALTHLLLSRGLPLTDAVTPAGLERTFGKPLAAVEAEWRAHIGSLK